LISEGHFVSKEKVAQPACRSGGLRIAFGSGAAEKSSSYLSTYGVSIV